MAILVRGQKVDLTKVNPMLTNVKVGLGWDVRASSQSCDLDAMALLLDANGQLVNKENIIFYNNLNGAQGAVRLTTDNRTGVGAGDDEQILINLNSIPVQIKKIIIAINIHEAIQKNQNFGQVINAFARIVNEQNGQELYRFDLGKDFTTETTIIVGEVYLHNGEWKFAAIGQGITGGVSGLCSLYNLQTTPSFFIKAPLPNPVNTIKSTNSSSSSNNPASINLSKIELKKSGDKINLNKTNSPLGEILVNLNWNQRTNQQSKGFFNSLLGSGSSVDLDLGCLYELEDGYRGVIQALGRAFGDLNREPYINLDHDDRSGSSVGGENLRINGNQIKNFKRILVFAYIYEGAVNWAEVDGVVTLKQQNGPDIVVRLDEHRRGKGMCAIALLENVNNQTLSVKKVVEYFNGHQQMDKAFNWGLRWTTGSK